MITCAADAELNLQAARRQLDVARRAFEEEPHDCSREGVVDAEIAYEDALAIAAEWATDVSTCRIGSN